MAEITPFRGLLYNKDRIGRDYSNVTAPPYDVISADMQDKLYKVNEYNVIRLILGKTEKDDTKDNNQYTRARDFLSKWVKEGILKQDDPAAFYVYLQEYCYGGKKHKRIGFIGLMKIESSDKDVVLPHEHTHIKPKEDRLNLIKEVRCNLSPLFTLYEDTQGVIKDMLDRNSSDSNVVIDIDLDGVRHKLWRILDQRDIGKIISHMRDKKIFIADGHHRYEVAKTYSDICKKGTGACGGSDYVMMYFTDIKDSSNLTIMATHRVIKKLPDVSGDKIMARLKAHFDVLECRGLSELVKYMEKESGQNGVFGLLSEGKYVFLKAKDAGKLSGLIRDKKSEEWKRLDVSMLHFAVLKNILAVDDTEGNVAYVKTPEEAEKLVESGEYSMAFLLNPTKVEQLRAVAELGEMMPQKSTYFYPKLLTGLVMHRFEA